ncbi:phage/plasmid primase, P4 family [Chordicoccus furentiruminis]|uniref:phage/plasmid primase, P4 family n=1 Tax=Chordicoccus furentiruminis TaxID=2709410 RepID=UPI0023A90BEC|nr:phage/plasmid primase, P4 family [Chordicoccus furentiruminis]
MLLHVDRYKFNIKPERGEIGGIKSRFTKSASIKDMNVKQIAAALTAGKTIQPGVCPFSERSRAAGKNGTVKEDFARQTIFLDDIDNKRTDVPIETPAHVAEVLAAHNLKAAFMYDTFNSTDENERFRVAVVCGEEITDKDERDRIQRALIALFPQSDTDCTNADRIFFGTEKGLIDGHTDYEAVCSKADLLALADEMQIPEHPEQEEKAAKEAQAVKESPWTKFGEIIPTGQRHGTLVSFAATVLTKYGITEQAHEIYMQRVAQCEEPKPDDEIEKIWRDACKHYEKNIATNPAYLTPAEYVAQEFAQSVEPTDYTDVGQARVFMAQYGDRLKYSAATKWLVYDGKVWNESELQARKLSQELTDRQLKDARKRLKAARAAEDAAIEAGDEEAEKDAKQAVRAAKEYRSFVLDRRKTSRIAATLTEAEPMAEIAVSELDKDGFLLNTPAGTVDLKTGKMRPHDPQDFITKMTAVSPSLDGMNEWLAFLDRLTCGDRELQDYLQVCSGMEAVGSVYVEKLTVAYGRGGNGKSTFYNAKARAMGDYYGTLSAETLTVNCRKNKSPEYAELRGKRLVIAAELQEGMRLDTAVVKQLCSTDPIQAEKKYKDPFKFLPSHTTVLYTNHLPKVGTNDSGTWDRLVVVPFNARFRGMQGEILNYTEYLLEHCGGAILSWVIEGARKFYAAGFHIEQPECVKRAIAEYRFDNDWLNAFLEECCEVSPEHTQRAGDLFDAYRTHCTDTHEWARGAGDFKAALTGAGFNWRKTAAGAFYYGLKLKSDFEPIVPL